MLPPIAVVSIPKSGTHLLTRFVELLGYQHGGILKLNPHNGNWYKLLPNNTHTSINWLQSTEPFHPATEIPILFIYRNPLDILVSEANYIHQDSKTSYWSYFSETDVEERIYRLIHDDWLLGSIRDRMADYVGWMNLKNVIPVSFEELVGLRGGGCDNIQEMVISSILDKLKIKACPKEIGSKVFDKTSPTFREGQIGSYKHVFTERCYYRFAELNQDFMEFMGYQPVNVDPAGNLKVDYDAIYSSRMEEFRSRRLVLSSGQHHNIPSQIDSDFFGYNLVLYRKNYYALPQSLGNIDMTALEDQQLASFLSANNLDALRFLVLYQTQSDKKPTRALSTMTPGDRLKQFACFLQNIANSNSDDSAYESADVVQLVKEGFAGFNILYWQKKWYGLDQGLGPIRLDEVSKKMLKDLSKRNLCVVENSITSLEAKIVKLAHARNR